MFVTYTHPSQLRDPVKRRQVSSLAARPRRDPSRLITKHTPGSFKAWRKHPEPSGALSQPARSSALQLSVDATETDIDETELVMWHSLLLQSIGGIRTEPFDAYPIRSDGLVPIAVDYFLQVYAPANDFIFKDFEGGNPIVNKVFPLALNSDIVFESITLMMLSHCPSGFGDTARRDQEFTLYRGIVLRKLQRRLADPATRADDTTLQTLLGLMSSDFYFGLDHHVETHLKGLQELVRLRGGLENIDLWLRVSIIGEETMCSLAMQRRQGDTNQMTGKIPIDYPSHPFDPELCLLISKLPRGFEELALTTKLSTQVIKIMLRCSSQLSGDQADPSTRGTDNLIADLSELAMTSMASDLEKSISLALLVYTATISRSGSVNWLLKSPVKQLGVSLPLLLETQSTKERDVVLWISMIVAGISDPSIAPIEQQRMLVGYVAHKHPIARKWESLIGVLKRFFWDDKLVERWHTAWKLAS